MCWKWLIPVAKRRNVSCSSETVSSNAAPMWCPACRGPTGPALPTDPVLPASAYVWPACHPCPEPLSTSPSRCLDTCPPPVLGNTTSRHTILSLALGHFILEFYQFFRLLKATGCFLRVGEGWKGGAVQGELS